MFSNLLVIAEVYRFANWISDFSWCSFVLVSGWKAWSEDSLSCWSYFWLRLIYLVRSFF
jgi:hypothetical protein